MTCLSVRSKSNFWWPVLWSISFLLSDQNPNNKCNPSHAALILSTSQLSLLSRSLRFLNGFPSKQSTLLWSWYLVLSNFCACIVSVDGRVKVVSVRISTQTRQWGWLTIRSGFLPPFICAENNSPVSFSPLSRSDTMYFDVVRVCVCVCGLADVP